ncbi:MAG: AAA family ATPase [Nitrososphaeria archaeon]
MEIEGRNGTGKTTLLNCLALALGYLHQEKELERKPALKRKLQDLEDNPTLEYRFRICCNIDEPIDLLIERTKGQKQKCWLNSKPVSVEVIDRKFEIVFLTEDDPKKVVNAIVGKLSKYFNDLEKGLISLQSAINKHLMDIREFREFQKKEQNTLREIESLKQSIANKTAQLDTLNDKIQKVELREQIKSKLELLNNKDKIISRYNALKKKHEQLINKTSDDIVRKLSKERQNLRRASYELKDIDERIIQICGSLKIYGVQIQSEKLLQGDYSELNELNRKIQPQRQKISISIRMVEDMIELFQRYSENEIVPLLEKTVREVLQELIKIKARLASDRVFGLLTALNNAMDERKAKMMEINKIQDKISELSQKSKDLEEFDKVHNEFVEAEQKYLQLQMALRENLSELLSKWSELSLIDEKLEDLQKQSHDLEISKRTDENLLCKLQENLALLRESATKKPKYVEEESELKALFERVSHLREYIFQWIQILKDPAQAKELLGLQQQSGFGLQDYEKFIKAVGEYLGNQFEPVAYDYRFHEIKFFDIERDTFITREDRQIPINKLSQGQSKIATLTGVFKKMDPTRKKIVLIDEIAELDPENLQIVKKTLSEEYKKGSLILAILVRPPRESSSKIIEIRGWD